jgi:Fe2+ transport system protein FeoA
METQNKTIKSIETLNGSRPDMNDIVERLYDLGLYAGLEIQILRKVSFGKITILQFDQTLLALNETEMSCLKF